MDIDCYSRVPGRPFMPIEVYEAIRHHLGLPTPAEEAAAEEAAAVGAIALSTDHRGN